MGFVIFVSADTTVLKMWKAWILHVKRETLLNTKCQGNNERTLREVILSFLACSILWLASGSCPLGGRAGPGGGRWPPGPGGRRGGPGGSRWPPGPGGGGPGGGRCPPGPGRTCMLLELPDMTIPQKNLYEAAETNCGSTVPFERPPSTTLSSRHRHSPRGSSQTLGR